MNTFFSCLRSMRSLALAGLIAVVGAGATSHAGVVTINVSGYSGPNGGVPNNDFAILSNFSGGGSNLIIINNAFGGYSGFSVQAGVNDGIAASGGMPLKFGAGQSIDGSFVYESGYSDTTFNKPANVSPDFGPNSFLGFKDGAGRFGYLEVTWTAATNTFTLLSAAYESTPGVAIQTPGGLAPVPEPSSVLFASVSVVGAAVKRYRRKRAKADFQSPTKTC
ncbi:MAG: hypothetical protein RL215_3032 [Planctomycetota bacterium]